MIWYVLLKIQYFNSGGYDFNFTCKWLMSALNLLLYYAFMFFTTPTFGASNLLFLSPNFFSFLFSFFSCKVNFFIIYQHLKVISLVGFIFFQERNSLTNSSLQDHHLLLATLRKLKVKTRYENTLLWLYVERGRCFGSTSCLKFDLLPPHIVATSRLCSSNPNWISNEKFVSSRNVKSDRT